MGSQRTHLGGHYGKSKLGIAKNRARRALGEASNYAEAPIFYFPLSDQPSPPHSVDSLRVKLKCIICIVALVEEGSTS